MDPDSRELLDLALPTLRDYGVVLLDTHGMIIEWLCGAEDIFGYTADEVRGRDLSLLFVPEDVDKGLAAHEMEVARRDSYAHDDRWHQRKDGARIWASGTMTALRNEQGLRGYIKVLRDRTDLRMESGTKANQLAALESAMARTHRFLQTLGHELRNPLAPIRNAAQIARRANPDQRVAQAASIIDKQLCVLERIAADLMEVTRLQHRKLELKLAELDVCALVAEEADGFGDTAQAKGLSMEAILPEAPLLVNADGDRLRQALSNLIVNAIKYTPAGGSVWIKATQEADEIVVRVQDTGIGIAPDVLPRIFELFTQESRARDLVPGGLGVGLAIVSQIAELHGGAAQARSGGTGKGSEFTIRIPRTGPYTQPPCQGALCTGQPA